MPPFGPVKRIELVRCLMQIGFEGPFPGGRHQFMKRGICRLILPNPHQSDVGRNLLAEILRQAGVSREDWQRL